MLAVRKTQSDPEAGGRATGLALTIALHLLALGAVMLKWQSSHVAPPPPAALRVFDVAPPAAPPEPAADTPPEPQRQEKKAPAPPEPRLAPIEPPIVPLPAADPVTIRPPRPVADPGPPVERTTAPEPRPLPPAATASNAAPSWEGAVMARLDKYLRYPTGARARRQQGVPWVRFVMDRDGRVLSSRLERSSGVADLDREAVALPRRAQPLPRPPEERRGDTIELVVPVEFFVKG